MGVVKALPVVTVDIAFRGRTFRQNYLMRFEFEMEIVDLADCIGLLDCHSIDEVLGPNQVTIENQRMPRRQPQVSRRDLGRQRTGAHHDGQHFGVVGDKSPGIAAPADPFDRLCLTRNRHDHVTDRKVLDRDLAAFRLD